MRCKWVEVQGSAVKGLAVCAHGGAVENPPWLHPALHFAHLQDGGWQCRVHGSSTLLRGVSTECPELGLLRGAGRV